MTLRTSGTCIKLSLRQPKSRYGTTSGPALHGTETSQARGGCQPIPPPLPLGSLPPYHLLPRGKLNMLWALVVTCQFYQSFIFPSKWSYNTQLEPVKFKLSSVQCRQRLINYCRKVSFNMSVTKSGLSRTTSLTLEYHLLREQECHPPGASVTHLRHWHSCFTVLRHKLNF